MNITGPLNVNTYLPDDYKMDFENAFENLTLSLDPFNLNNFFEWLPVCTTFIKKTSENWSKKEDLIDTVIKFLPFYNIFLQIPNRFDNFCTLLAFLQAASYKRENDEILKSLKKECMTQVKSLMGVHMEIEGECLYVKIYGKVKLDIISTNLSQLSEIFHVEIEKFSPDAKLNHLANFLKESGGLVQFLNLELFEKKAFDDTFITKVIPFCTNLTRLTIKSDDITETVLKVFKNCTRLKKLCLHSASIKEYNSKLPESLLVLDLLSCPNLKKIPEIPSKLKKIKLPNTPSMNDRYRLMRLGDIFTQNLRQGVLLSSGFMIKKSGTIGKLLIQKSTLSAIKAHLPEIKHSLPKKAMTSIMVELINKDLDFFLENISDFPLQDLDKIPSKKIPAWVDFNKGSLDRFKINPKSCVEEDLEDASFEDLPEIWELPALFFAINFEDKTKPDFVDPEYLTLDGKKTDRDTIGNNLITLLDRVDAKTSHIGTPLNDKKREEWYQKLKSSLRQFIKLAMTHEDKHLVATEIIALGSAAAACGGRWMAECHQSILSLQGILPSEDNIEEMIFTFINGYKDEIANSITSDLLEEVGDMFHPHLFNLVAKTMSENNVPVTNEMLLDFDDPVRLIDTNKIKEEIQHKLNEYLLPVRIAKYIEIKINEILRAKPEHGMLVLIPLKEYVEHIHPENMKAIENSLEQKKLNLGKAKVKFLISQNKKSENKQMEIEIETGVRDEFKSKGKRKAEVQDDERVLKKRRTQEQNQAEAIDINQYKLYDQNNQKYLKEIKLLGEQRAHQEVRFEKENFISDYLSDNKWVIFNPDDSIFITLKGAFMLLKQLGYLIE